MADIVLATLNAKYIHASFGLRYLLANLGELTPRAVLREFEIQQRPIEVVEKILQESPLIVGFGIYIWNVTQTAQVVSTLKRLRPGIKIVLGGPEVSYETEGQRIVVDADHVITGEADLAFAQLCRQLLAGQPPQEKVIPATLPELTQLQLPYHLYSSEDLEHRVVYVEASRGCPFTCEFCLSSLDIPVRQFPLDRFFASMQSLLDRGLKQFKFVDRTFNLNLNVSRAILRFFLDQHQPGRFYHFEMVPDRLPVALRELIAQFPPGTVQFEIGIQTFNEEASKLIHRRQNLEALADNFAFLRQHTGVHLHADLIVGLPGEDLASFGRGFDRLVALGPQEIQIGILKRLRGTPIIRHDQEWGMVYSPEPPYEILENRLIGFEDMQKMRRFSRFWDLVVNSGHFVETAPRLWKDQPSPFTAFLNFSLWLFEQSRRTDQIALRRLMEWIFEYVTARLGQSPEEVAPGLWADYVRTGKSDRPRFLAPYLTQDTAVQKVRSASLPKRQSRHSTHTPVESD